MVTISQGRVMNVLVEGRINYSLTMKDLLKRIFQMQMAGTSFIRIISSDGALTGRIFILDSTFITGADSKESGEVGYPVLKKLLKINEGSFAIVSMRAGDPVDGEFSMNIEIRKIFENIENLPDNPSILFDQNALLDKVFNPAIEAANATLEQQQKPSPVNEETHVQSILGKVLVAEGTNAKPDVNWSAVKPLLGDESGIPPVVHFGAQYTANNQNNTQNNGPRSTHQRITGQLRSISSLENVERKRTARRFFTIIGLVVVASAVGYGVFHYLIRNTPGPMEVPAAVHSTDSVAPNH
jgi:hypothetical protein